MAGIAGGGLAGAGEPQRVIDTHIHLFDPTRPQGVPWPGKEDTVLYRPALPDRYRALAEPHGIKGAIVVEASPWLEDNQWVLDIAAKSPVILGVVGNLDPGDAAFRAQLERFHKNPLFRGIRYGNLWDRNLGTAVQRLEFRHGLQDLAAADLALDTANPDAKLLDAVLRVTDAVPSLRIVIDHLPQMTPFPEAGASVWRDLAKRQQVFVKVSEVLRRVAGRVPLDVAFYRDRLDLLWSVFGPDRVLFGSDWPNSDGWGTYAQVIGLMREYLAGKPPDVVEKYFALNSRAAYRWRERS